MKIDMGMMRDEMEGQLPWDFCESEGSDCVRFDYNDTSIWVYASGTVDYLDSLHKAMQKKVMSIVNACAI